jgi:protease-4
VFAGKPVLNEFWQEVGVNWGRVQRGANATMWSTQTDYSERGRKRLQAFLDQTYAAFLGGVARGRELPEAKVRAAAEGRVWTGAQAKELGLVDDLGGFPRAVELAREAAGAAAGQPVALRRFPPARPPWERALELLGQGGGGFELAAAVRAWLGLLTPGGLSAPPLIVR